MDEYIVIKDFDNIGEYISSLPTEIKNIKLGQIRFDSRFNNTDKLVTDITNAEIKDLNRNHSNKNIYNVKHTIKAHVHYVVLNRSFNSNIREYRPSTKEIWFNHYKINSNDYKHVNNINVNIKTKLNKYSFITLK